jgi:hypothetical protein
LMVEVGWQKARPDFVQGNLGVSSSDCRRRKVERERENPVKTGQADNKHGASSITATARRRQAQAPGLR